MSIKRKLRRLAWSIYERTKGRPWEKVQYTGIDEAWLHSPDVPVNGKALSLTLQDKLIVMNSGGSYRRLRVLVNVDGETTFPGGVYEKSWPWCWEKKLVKKLKESPSCTFVPEARNDLVEILEDSDPSEPLGRLSLPSQEEG